MNIKEIIQELEASNEISLERSFEYGRMCSKLLRGSENEEQEGRRIIINVLDNWEKFNEESHEMWADLIEAAGFYPYLEKERSRLIFRNTAGEIRKWVHKSENLSEFFHEQQKDIKDLLNGNKNVIVSAPTSFGKSLLIQEIVASKKYNNIVIIQPTLALIDETRNKLKKYSDSYKIIVKTSQKPSRTKGNLFILTAERVMEYPELPRIDFAIVDEFYKLSSKRDEERSDVLNNALNMLLNKQESRFYMLGPNIDNISSGFEEKYNAKFFKTQYSLVDNRVIDASSEYFGQRGKANLRKVYALFDLLWKLKDEQTIIYCSSPMRVRYISKKFCRYLDKMKASPKEELSLVEWIKTNVDVRWSLIDCLNHGIGIHDGALQKHITSSIIHYFNRKKLNYLFCTTTIIEGVNTSAKNVVFFDRTKGLRKPIDYFDYSNIKGRSGRMMVHYVGRIFNFNKPPEKKPVIVDIPFFDQDNVSDEVLINIEDKHIRNKETEQYKRLKSIPPEERGLFKKNGVSVIGQKNILETIRENITDFYPLLFWESYPKYHQLYFVLSLAWENLIKRSETIRPMTLPRLVKVTSDYARNQNISHLIKNNYEYFKRVNLYGKDDDELLDDAVMIAFQILRHWFHYKVPKWLNVINNIQKYVCEKNNLPPGNYTFFSNMIENDFVRENLSVLVEVGIPKSAINKLEEFIPSGLEEDNILDEIRKRKLFDIDTLSLYEKEKILENM